MSRDRIENRWRYPFASLAVVAALALVAGGSAATGATPQRQPPAAGATLTRAAYQAAAEASSEMPAPQLFDRVEDPEPMLDHALLAKTLALRVTLARTPAARYQALFEAMRALQVGLYTGKGQPIVRGAERGPKDFYLYSFELGALAKGLERGTTVTLSEVAADLTAIGFRPHGQPLGAERLRQVLVALTRSSLAKPTDAKTLGLLLLRELGLRHRPPYDIAQNPPLTAVRLDALQRWLLTADIAGPFLHLRPRRSAAVASGPAGPCGFLGDAELEAWKYGKIGNFFLPVIGESLRLVEALVDLEHALLVGLVLDIQETVFSREHPETHYGPPGHYENAGKPLIFQIGVQMIARAAQIPAEVIACGRLLGLEIPPVGPVKGVPVNWQSLYGRYEYERLKKYGTIIQEERQTNERGLASLVLQPKEEKVPGFGPNYLERTPVKVKVAFLKNLGNLLAHLAEAVAPKVVTIEHRVSHHQPRGFKFSGLKWRVERPDPVYGVSYSQYELLSARVCGDDPFNPVPAPLPGWETRIYVVSDWPITGHHREEIVTGRWLPGPGGATEGHFYVIDTLGAEGHGDWVSNPPGTPPQVRLVIRVNFPEDPPQVFEQVTLATVFDDESCPGNRAHGE